MLGYENQSDQQLVAFLKDGDAAAFTEIYDRYFWLLHIHALKWLKNREEVKDIIHEIFSALWQKRESLDFRHGLAGYLYASVRNRIFNQIAHQRIASKYLKSLDDFIHSGECLTDHKIREQQLILIIENEIASMPEKMRTVFELSRKQNLSHREIADQLYISEQTVRKHIQHALRLLRFRLGIYIVALMLIHY